MLLCSIIKCCDACYAVFLKSKNRRYRIINYNIRFFSNIRACALCHTGRSVHIARRSLVKQKPRKLRVVDKHITVALNILGKVIALHFPFADGVVFHPFEEHFLALDNSFSRVLCIVRVRLGKLISFRVAVAVNKVGIKVRLLPSRINI